MMNTKCEIYHDNFQNYKKYGIPKAQLVIADIPYNIGNNFYGSNPKWYNNGNNKDGESKLAGKAAEQTILSWQHIDKLLTETLKMEWDAENYEEMGE